MDISQLLKLLNEQKVEFLIIGASAFPVHGYSRATLDFDIFIRPTQKNAQATLNALSQFGYDLEDLSVKDLLEKKILIRGYLVQTDIHPFVAGITNFEEIWERRISGTFEGIEVFYPDLDHIIKMKQAAGRPKDLEDLKFLKKLKAKL